MPERDRAPDAALLAEAEIAGLYLDGMAATAHGSAQPNIRGVSRLVASLATALRAHHAALDGATVELVCACGHREGQHHWPLLKCDDTLWCQCATFTPRRERVTYEREITQ